MKPLISRNPVFRVLTTVFYYAVAVPLLDIAGRLVFGLRVRGRKNLRGLRGAVVVCNHVHNLDCSFLGILLFPRKMVFTSVEFLFRRPVVGPLIRILGSVPVPSSLSGMRRFISEMTHAVQNGRTVCIYPEGELVPYCGQLREFRDGAFLIAARAGVPVVPVLITQRECRGLWKALKKKPCLTITAERPIVPDMESGAHEAARELSAVAFRTMSQMQNAQDKKNNAVKRPA